MVVVIGDVAGLTVMGLALPVRERVPYGRTLAVLVRRSLDLVGRRGGAPQEPFGKGHRSSIDRSTVMPASDPWAGYGPRTTRCSVPPGFDSNWCGAYGKPGRP